MNEPTKRELNEIFQTAYLACSERGDPDVTMVSDCSEAGQRALYNAGRADAEPRWIPSKAGLPSRGTRALVRRDDGEVELLVCYLDLHFDASTRWYPVSGDGSIRLDEVTHWMALPPDPVGEVTSEAKR